MSRLALASPPPFNAGLLVVLAIAAAVAGAVFVAQSQFGPAVSADSIHYYARARDLAHSWRGYQPPFYPWSLMAVRGVFGLSLSSAATFVNALALGLTTAVVAMWVRMRGASVFVTVWAGLLCGSSVLFHYASWALTDSLFVALATLSLFALDEYGRTHGGRRRDAWIGLAATTTTAAACFTRPVGVPLIGLLALSVFAFGASSRPRRLAVAAAAGVCALAPTAAWFLLHWTRLPARLLPTGSGGSHFVREPMAWLWTPAATERFDLWTEKLFDTGAYSLAGIGLKAILLCVLGGVAGTLGFLTREHLRAAQRTFVLIAVFFLAYVGWLVVSLSFTNTVMQARYLLPLYAPGLVLVTLILHGCIAKTNAVVCNPTTRRPTRDVRCLVWCLALTSLAACQGTKLHQQMVDTYDGTKSHLAQGGGYSAKQWRQSETMAFLRQMRPAPELIVSEDRPAVVLGLKLTGEHGEPSIWTEFLHARATKEGTQEQFAAIRTRTARDTPQVSNVLAVWFHDFGRAVGRSDDKSRRLLHWLGTPGLRVVNGLKDGVVFALDAETEAVLEVSSLTNAVVAGVLNGAELIHRSQPFDLYTSRLYERHQVGDQLIYRFHDCDAAREVFLHVVPIDLADLPAEQARSGFDNLDHQFGDESRYIYPPCLAVVDLPAYPVNSISTGQWSAGGEIWRVRIPFGQASPDGSR